MKFTLCMAAAFLVLYVPCTLWMSDQILVLKDADPKQRQVGLVALRFFSDYTWPSVVQGVVSCPEKARLIADHLNDPSASVRIDALKVVAKLRPSLAAVHRKKIEERLHHDNTERYLALHALLALSSESHESVISASLHELLRSVDTHNRLQGLKLLSKTGLESLTKYETVLVELLDGTDSDLHRAAREQVCRILPLIVRRLDTDDVPSRLRDLRVINLLEPYDWFEYHEIFVEMLMDPHCKIRTNALQLLGKLDRTTSLKYQYAFVRLFADVDDEVRRTALKIFGKLNSGSVFVKHVGALACRLADDDEDIRHSAIQVLSTLDSNVLSKHADDLLNCLADPSDRVSYQALDVATKLDLQALMSHAHQFLQLLGDPSVAKRNLSLKILQSIPEILSAHAKTFSDASDSSLQRLKESLKHLPKQFWSFHESNLISHMLNASRQKTPNVETLMSGLVNRMDDKDATVCFYAVLALRQLEGETLVKYKYAFLRKLGVSEIMIRQVVLDVLCKFKPSELANHVNLLLELLHHSDTYLRQKSRMKTLEIFLVMQPEEVSEKVQLIMQLLNDADAEVRNAALSIVARLRPAVLSPHLHFQLGQADTVLHVAAEAGHLNACKALVSAGASLKVKNLQGKTPVDIAQEKQQTEVFDFFEARNRRSFTTIHGGTGDALQAALADDRRVIKVDWYTIPLTAWWAPSLGLEHSLVAITVGDLGEPHVYVIEKAAAQRTLLDSDTSAVKYGVYVSHWVDVAPKLENPSTYAYLERANLASNVGGRALQMRTLIDIAVKLGPYDVGNCNCHHAARAVYNSCALPEQSIKWIPNQNAAWASSMLQTFGINVAESEIPSRSHNGSGSVYHSQSTQYKNGNFQGNDIDIRSIPWSSTAASLANWIYLPRPGNVVSFFNRIPSDIVVNITGAPKHLTLLPGQSGSIATSLEDVYAEIHRENKVERCKVSIGQHYAVKRDLKDQLRCEQSSPLPEGVTKHFLNLARGTNLVQWSLLTLEDTIYVTFRGTEELRDVLANIAVGTDDEASHGLRVHSGMWNFLNQRKHSVIRALLKEIKTLQNSNQHLVHVVFCGHSLGGGYAILSALAMFHEGVNVSAVLAFGAPQVVVPDPSSAMWRILNRSTTLFVNAYDAVPRMPACLDWIFHIAPKAVLSLGSATLDLTSYLNSSSQHLADILLEYDTVGNMIFLNEGSRRARSVPSVSMSSHKELLCQAPRDIHKVAFGQHQMAAYASIIIDGSL